MTFDEYQKRALTTALRSGSKQLDTTHWVLGIVGESGEIAEKYKKIIRDKNGKISKQEKQEFVKEIGDVLWHLAILAQELGFSFEDVAALNIQKLADRNQRGKIKGSGDNR